MNSLSKRRQKKLSIILNKQKKRPKISQKELDSMLSRVKTLYKYDPYNAPLLKVLVCWDISRDKEETIEAFEEGIRKNPNNIHVYIEYWKFLKYLKRHERMIELSERMIKAADSSSVPTDQWIEAHDLRFKSLLMKGNSKDIIEEAVNTLKKICYILPPLPVDGLWYIQDAQEEAELERELEENKNESPEKPSYGDSLSGSKSTNIRSVTSNRKSMIRKSETCSAGFFLSLKDKRSHKPMTKENMINKIQKHLRGSSRDFSSSSRDEGIKGLKVRKKGSEEYKSSEKDDASSISSNFEEYDNFLRVTFKSDFLYQIGKVCAKSGFMLEKALKYLNDFLLVINYYKQDMDTKSYQKLRAHAIYYIGIAYFQLGDKEMAEEILREIHMELVDTQGKDSKKVKKIDSILSNYFTKRFDIMKECVSDYFKSD